MANEAVERAKDPKAAGDPIDPRKAALGWVPKPTPSTEVDEIKARYDNAERTGFHFSRTPRKKAKTA
jgi:hypothetical protein